MATLKFGCLFDLQDGTCELCWAVYKLGQIAENQGRQQMDMNETVWLSLLS